MHLVSQNNLTSARPELFCFPFSYLGKDKIIPTHICTHPLLPDVVVVNNSLTKSKGTLSPSIHRQVHLERHFLQKSTCRLKTGFWILLKRIFWWYQGISVLRYQLTKEAKLMMCRNVAPTECNTTRRVCFRNSRNSFPSPTGEAFSYPRVLMAMMNLLLHIFWKIFSLKFLHPLRRIILLWSFV